MQYENTENWKWLKRIFDLNILSLLQTCHMDEVRKKYDL